VAQLKDRNPDSAPGDWYIDTHCIDCLASAAVAPGLIVERNDKCVFARQPRTPEEERAAWRAVLVCPTASVGTVARRAPPPDLFPQELAPGVFRCGYNARSSYGAHSYFAARPSGNLLVDAPRFTGKLVRFFRDGGGIAHVLLTHRDDVGDAERYAREFGARVWIHEADRAAAPFATDLVRGADIAAVTEGVRAIPAPGHTRGSVMYLMDGGYLFTGDSLAWDFEREDLTAFRDACWYSWEKQTQSLGRLAQHRFEWVLAGHGGSVHLPAAEMQRRLRALVERMAGRGC
jgi:glyoxylase-like metal-dependent hydrolase (beta-lactamase superfamily II)